jgi:hypothetical protein
MINTKYTDRKDKHNVFCIYKEYIIGTIRII